MSETKDPKLSASYESPDNAPFTVSESLPILPADPSVDAKTKYLSSLREAVSAAQEQINKELTQRMDDDKARLANGSADSKVDDAKEEENYGEEVPDPED